jgi:hypothetical protein
MPPDRIDLAADLRAKALHARLHAINLLDRKAAEDLSVYADELDAQASKLEAEE